MPAGFESIIDMPERVSDNAQELVHVDSWDDCYDCNYNCEESNSG